MKNREIKTKTENEKSPAWIALRNSGIFFRTSSEGLIEVIGALNAIPEFGDVWEELGCAIQGSVDFHKRPFFKKRNDKNYQSLVKPRLELFIPVKKSVLETIPTLKSGEIKIKEDETNKTQSVKRVDVKRRKKDKRIKRSA